ncbi:MAG: hypothetical protein V9G19_10735 [Tetrasphaera sp.]
MSSDMEKFIGPRVPADEFKAHRARYIMPTLLFVAAAVLLIISIQQPWWRLKLNAPQYPAGLLRHRLREPDDRRRRRDRRAEPLHRHAPAQRSGCLRAVDFGLRHHWPWPLLILAAAFVHTKWVTLLVLPALFLPVIFLADLQFWLANFGLNLDPAAPLSSSVDPFIPPVLWVGKIAQFSTVPRLLTGFWLAVTASALILVGLFFHRRAYKPLVEAQAEGCSGRVSTLVDVNCEC